MVSAGELRSIRERITCSSVQPWLGLTCIWYGYDPKTQDEARSSQTGNPQGRKAGLVSLFFVLVGKDALWHN